MSRLQPLHAPHAVLLLGFLLATACGDAPDAPRLGTLRLPLLPAALADADVVHLTAEGEDGPIDLWRLDPENPPPAGQPLFLRLPPGQYDALTLDASIGGLPLAHGESEPFSVAPGAEVDVEVVIDLLGVLRVLPIGLLLDAIDAVPLAPLPGQPERHSLSPDGEGFVGTLPTGRYRLEIELPLNLRPVELLEFDVRAGEETTEEITFAPIISRLSLRSTPIRALGGLLRGADLTVEAVDEDGQPVPEYRGTVHFRSEVLLGNLVDIQLPVDTPFTEADAGTHVFADGLRLTLLDALLPTLVRITVTEEALGLQAEIEVELGL